MTDLKRRSLVAALGAAPIAVPLLAHAQSAGLESKFKQIPSRERIRQRYFPNLILTDQNGRKLKFYDDLVKDKIVIFNMFYAQCEGICTPVTRNLVRLQQVLGNRVGKDIFMYSFSLKPKDDTVAALNQAGVASDFTYVSTAGGAFLEWMEGKPLPGVEVLKTR